VGGEEGAVAMARELEAMEEVGEAQKRKYATSKVLAALQEEGEEHTSAAAAAAAAAAGAGAVRMHGRVGGAVQKLMKLVETHFCCQITGL